MRPISPSTLETMRWDLDGREAAIRQAVYEAMADLPPADLSEHIVTTYFVVAHSMSPAQEGAEISYHMISGVRKPKPGSLLAQCNGVVVDAVSFDTAERIGIVRVAFPLKMLADEQGNVYSTDLLHIMAGEGQFGLTEHADIKLVHMAMSDATLRRFPGPAYGAEGVRKLAHFGPDEFAFGTILKPCTGITSQEEEKIVEQAAANPLFLFMKEDENFLPSVSFAPLSARLKHAHAAIRRAADRRGGKGVVFAPSITAPPHLLAEYVKIAVDTGVNGVMFSEYFTGGTTRMVRELTRHLPNPPAICGHNGGITVRTRYIYREVLDLLARLDGEDFRQTAPVTFGPSLLRSAGQEWRECEKALSMPLAGRPTVMITRAGGLDQGNIIPNLMDVESGIGAANYLFLAGSAINGIKNDKGEYDPAIGAEAMQQALQVFREGFFKEISSSHAGELKAHADARGMRTLGHALGKRYG